MITPAEKEWMKVVREKEDRIAQLEAENESLRHSLNDCTEQGANIAVIVRNALGTAQETEGK